MHFSRRWFLFFLLIVLVGCRQQGLFGSDRQTTTVDNVMTRRPLEVSFEELDADPSSFVNRFVRVQGAYLSLEDLPCDEPRGPARHWALVNAGLRLDTTGFSRIMQLVPQGTMLTIDGFWRYYEGPMGCGKEPGTQTAWYVEVVRVVQPNPLPQLGAATGEPSPRQTGTPDLTPTPPVGAVGGSPTSTPTTRAPVTPTLTETPDPLRTPTPTPTATSDASPTPSRTPEPGEPSPTPDDGTTPTPTTSGSTPTSPPATSTTSGYPAPPPDPTEEPPPY